MGDAAGFGPKRFFYYSLFESDQTGAPLAIRNRAAGSTDLYAAAVGRWLVTRDGFDFLAYYLSDFDYASHAHGPTGADDVALERIDAAIAALLDAAGGPDAFLERYAVVVHSDHGQTHVDDAARLEAAVAAFADEIVVTASNRAGQVYLLPNCARRRGGARAAARRRRRRSRRRFAAKATTRSRGATARSFASVRRTTAGRRAAMRRSSTTPTGCAASWSALANPNAGELLVSAAEGWELTDLGGRHHAGGGSHGSLVAGDSIVPLLTIGVDAEPARITEVAPAVLAHFGVEPPPYARALVHAA